MNDKVTLGQPRPKRRRAAVLQGPFVVMRMRRQTAIGEVDAPASKEVAAGHDSNEHSRVTLLADQFLAQPGRQGCLRSQVTDRCDSLGFVLSPRLSPAIHELKFLWRPFMWVDERTIH